MAVGTEMLESYDMVAHDVVVVVMQLPADPEQ